MALVLTPNDPYERAATLITDVLSRSGCTCTSIRIAQSRSEGEPETAAAGAAPSGDGTAAQLLKARPKAVVAFGTAATAFALETLPNTPVVFCMVPNIADRQFSAKPDADKARLLGVTTDIAPADQVAWIKRLSPVKTLGVLISDRSRRTGEQLVAKGEKAGIKVQVISASHKDFPAAIKALEDQGCEGVLMIADADVYNAASVQRLLLWGLRSRKPVWAFSANLVKAGAFAGLYAEPESIARQTAELTRQVLGGQKPAGLGVQHPQTVLVAGNVRTAELIGITLSKDALECLTTRYGQ